MLLSFLWNLVTQVKSRSQNTQILNTRLYSVKSLEDSIIKCKKYRLNIKSDTFPNYKNIR